MEGFIALVVAVLVVLGGVLIAAQIIGKASMAAVSQGTPAQIREAARACFSTTFWVPESGPGVINMRKKALRSKGRSVVSVSIEPDSSGGQLVTVWMSYGASLMELGDAMVVRRIQKRILSTVSALPHTSAASNPSY